MTNVEKAIEIANHPKANIAGNIGYVAAITMAEWKDKQFKEYLEKKKSDIEQGVLHSNPLIDGGKMVWKSRHYQ
jgi:hypothetical protein